MITATIEQRAIESRRFHKGESFESFNKDKTYLMGDWAYGYCQGATEQRQMDYDKLKSILNDLMIDTKDKCRILEAMEFKVWP